MSTLVLVSCSYGVQDEVLTLRGSTWGTTYSIRYLPNDGETLPSADVVHDAVKERLAEIDLVMSNWNQESEISKLNAHRVNSDLQIDQELAKLLEVSRDVYDASQGAFDISVGSLVDLWRRNEEDPLPTDVQIAAAQAKMGMHHLQVDLQASTAKKKADIKIILAAIAKGYGVDEIGRSLEGFGIKNYLVEIGGEVLAKGAKPDAQWRVAIEKPDEIARRSFDAISLEDMGMATSGDYRDYFEKDGVRYSHIIDPRTGRPVRHRLASVSVVHPSVTLADAWATALFVLGEQEGMRTAENAGIAAFFIVREDDGFISLATERFAAISE